MSRLGAGEEVSTTSQVFESQESQWCLVGNIVEERPYGEGGRETRWGPFMLSKPANRSSSKRLRIPPLTKVEG